MTGTTGDGDALAALRSGQESSVAEVVASWTPALLRTALALTGDRATSERAVRDVWLRVARELDAFRPPPGLRAWVLGLVVAAAGVEVASERAPAPLVDPARFLPPDDPQWPGHWKTPPAAWPAMDDQRTGGVGTALRAALVRLPTTERVVVGLRDVGGCEVPEIAALLGRTPQDVRDLLNRGRAVVRTVLEQHLVGAAGL